MNEPLRTVPPFGASEREMMQAFLDYQRRTLVWKVTGVDETAARLPLLKTSPDLTLAGLVRHLTAVERAWFRIVVAGEDVSDMADAADPKAFRPSDKEQLADLVAAYERECAAADLSVRSISLSERARMHGHEETLRWVMLHMIEETARHNGHADLIRESLDGAVGE